MYSRVFLFGPLLNFRKTTIVNQEVKGLWSTLMQKIVNIMFVIFHAT